MFEYSDDKSCSFFLALNIYMFTNIMYKTPLSSLYQLPIKSLFLSLKTWNRKIRKTISISATWIRNLKELVEGKLNYSYKVVEHKGRMALEKFDGQDKSCRDLRPDSNVTPLYSSWALVCHADSRSGLKCKRLFYRCGIVFSSVKRNVLVLYVFGNYSNELLLLFLIFKRTFIVLLLVVFSNFP